MRTLKGRVARNARLGALALAALVGAGAVGGAAAQAAPRVVESPRAGAKLRANTVRVVVRAGNEAGDLSARLNGISVGREFRRPGGGRRVLIASTSHGLRRGRNVLKVTTRTRTGTRRATVRFRVMRRQLAGAGRDLRGPIGMQRRIAGRIVGAGRARARWTLVAAPPASRLARRVRRAADRRNADRRAAGQRAVARSAAASATTPAASSPAAPQPATPAPPSTPFGTLTPVTAPLGSASVPLATLGTPAQPVVAFRPDVPGVYTLRLDAPGGGGGGGSGSGAGVSDTVQVTAMPRSPVLEVDTAATAAGGAPGIRLGATVYPAPPMAGTAADPSWAGDGYQALWQLIAVDRATLAPLWNRTYGSCNDFSQFCRIGAGGRLQAVDARQELADLGSSVMVIATSQRSAGWGSPDSSDFTTQVLDEVGFPSNLADLGFPINLAPLEAGSAAAIGVPGVAAGGAQIDVALDVEANGPARLDGYLGADSNDHYSFMAADRVPFDTRAAATCGGGTCTIAQTVGAGKATGTLPNGAGGYLVSRWDSRTLKLQGSQMFATSGVSGAVQDPAVVQMNAFLSRWALTDSVYMISSLRTPGLGTQALSGGLSSDWESLGETIRALGGTRDTFNRSAGFTEDSYSLLGWIGAEEHNGREVADGNGRLRGALAPNTISFMRPRNVSAVGQPNEQLTQLVLRKPVTVWPLDDDPAAHAALRWIGTQVAELGDSPRQAYWTQTIDLPTAELIGGRIGRVVYDPKNASYGGQSFTAADFAGATAELGQEILWVGNVRDYLSKLGAPQTKAGGGAWETASDLQDQLEKQLSDLDASAQMRFDWFSIASSVAFFAAPFFASSTEAIINSFGAATDLSDALFQGDWGGAPGTPQGRRVAADRLATEIEAQARSAAFAYARMGDMIVSDPTKLALLGKYAKCNPNGGCGPNGRYAAFSLPSDAQATLGDLALRAVNRELYRQLVPLAFPVWNTGKTTTPPGDGDVPSDGHNPVLGSDIFNCSSGESDDPFLGSPAGARGALLQQIDTNSPGVPSPNPLNVWEVSLMVARDGIGPGSYSWPKRSILRTMFTPASATNPDALGLTPADVMLDPVNVYQPGVFDICGWVNRP